MDSLVAVEAGDLVVVKQLPIIEDRLDAAHAAVQERLAVVAGLAVTEDNYKEIKKVRADLNKEFSELEALRKKVKKAIEAPYDAFEAGAYRRMADTYRDAIRQIDGEIKEVEGGLKSQRQKELLDYFEQYRQSLGLDAAVADPYRSGIKVGLTGTMKALKNQVREFLDRVDGDLKMIDMLDDRDEVLAEYRMSLNATDAIKVVAERHRRIEEARKQREASEAEQSQRAEQIAAVEAAVAIPVEEVAEEEAEVFSANYLGYEIFGTIEQLKALKAFLREALKKYMDEKGMKYNG